MSLLCGLSAPVRQLQGYPRALSQARQALDLCDTLRPTQRISDYQQLGFIKLLSAVSDPALLNDFMHDTPGCLIEPGRKAPWLLLETLETLLQENGNVVRAADRLGLHRNTLHQRIQRIEKLTGYPVSHPQFHLNASVALVIWRLSQKPFTGPTMKIINARLRRQEALLYSLDLQDGMIHRISAQAAMQSADAGDIDAQGRLAIPPFVEPHIHLDATLTAGEPEWNRSGTLFEGITRWSQRKASITPEDTRQRALKTIGMLRDFRRPARPDPCGCHRSVAGGPEGAAGGETRGRRSYRSADCRLPAGGNRDRTPTAADS